MKSIKLLFISLFAAASVMAQAPVYVQQMAAKDYGVFNQMNIGQGKLASTSPSAYLELGDSVSSRKGLLFPRGKKDSVANPAKGLVIFDIPSAKLHLFDGAAWVPLGAAGGSTGGTGTGGFLPKWSSNNTLTNSQLQDDGATVGVGIAPHAVFKLYVNGHGYFNGTIGSLAAVHSGPDWRVMVDRNGYFRYVPDSGAAKWGYIPGNINDQTDLVNTFQKKLPFGLQSEYIAGNHTLRSFAGDVLTAGNGVFAPFTHKHYSADILDLTAVVRNMFSGGTGIGYNAATGVITNTGQADSTGGGPTAPQYKLYTEAFAGTTANSFTITKTPLVASVVVYVNGLRVPREFWTLTVNTVQINATLLTYTTDTFDKIEISYQSTL